MTKRYGQLASLVFGSFMETLELRGYRQGDLAAMYALDTVCFQPPFRFSLPAMREFAEAENAVVRLACLPGSATEMERMLGFCIVHLERNRKQQSGYVVTLDVDPVWRGRGIAKMLMRSLEQVAGQMGARAMALHVFSGNLAAIRLYERLGYTFMQRAKGFYGWGLDALMYSKPLTTEEMPWRAADA